MDTKLPVFKLDLPDNDEDLGVSSVALVKRPAIDVNFITFSETQAKPKPLQLAVQDEDDQICIGPLLIPDQLIYRNDSEQNQPYYVTIDKETILAANIRFCQQNNGNKVDLEHDGQLVKGVTMIGQYVTNKKYGLLPPVAFSHLPDGTWFVQYKVEDPEIWAEIKAQTFSGFSITGLFEEVPDPLSLAQQLEEVLAEVETMDKPKPPYGNVDYADPGYQKDQKKRYPLDTVEHIRSAWSYINHPKNAGLYSAADLAKVKDKIVAAWKKKIDPKGPPSAQK
jgi:hypothetical protein